MNVRVDWDGDGNLDLVGGGVVGPAGGGPGHCAIVIRRGDGAGGFARSEEVGSASLDAGSTLAVADFDGDGLLDLAYAEGSPEATRWLRVLRQGLDGMLADRAMFEVSIPAPVGLPRILASADFDNDGRPDLLLGSADAFVVFLNRGGGAFEAVSSPLGGVVVRDFRVADFNADGIPDIALLSMRAGLADSVVILCGDGAGRFSACATVPLPPSTISTWLRVGDFDGDGRPDLAIDGGTAGFFVALNECPSSGSLVGVIPAVASSGGLYGAFFKTRLDLENTCVDNTCVDVVEGRLVFHSRGQPGSDFDRSVPFRLGPSEVLAECRFAIGLRTLAEGVALRATVRDTGGNVLKVVHRSFGPYRSIQESAQEFLGGFVLVGRERVTLSLLAGGAIIFGTTADNATSTPAIQIPLPARGIASRASASETPPCRSAGPPS